MGEGWSFGKSGGVKDTKFRTFGLVVHVTHHCGFATLFQQVVVEISRSLVIARELFVLLFDIGAQLYAALIQRDLPLDLTLLRGLFFDGGVILMYFRTQLLNFRRLHRGSSGSCTSGAGTSGFRGHLPLQVRDTLPQSAYVRMA